MSEIPNKRYSRQQTAETITQTWSIYTERSTKRYRIPAMSECSTSNRLEVDVTIG